METAWTVECGACETKYDQAKAGAGNLGPTICGACGSPRVRVTQHIVLFDRREEMSRSMDKRLRVQGGAPLEPPADFVEFSKAREEGRA